MILGNEGLHQARAHQQTGRSTNQGEQVVSHCAQTRVARLTAVPSNEGASQHEAGLATDENRRNL